ncbi:hypothetical protein [Halogeometricum sp. CBA1124]|uniref:hypothetical protein n=1 Tax=Halogeometricum sp. CBA1124 TaxID=2668071 RepID=UPI001E60A8C8|nr:hypothetical protein [Halogeometricum sp. CBA1124]
MDASDMPALWRLTRTDGARRLYEALKRVGVTGTRMYQYVADPRDDAGADADATASPSRRGRARRWTASTRRSRNSCRTNGCCAPSTGAESSATCS